MYAVVEREKSDILSTFLLLFWYNMDEYRSPIVFYCLLLVIGVLFGDG